jgi:polyisoprenoid-binding protein YceI
MPSTRPRRLALWLLGGVVVIAALAFGGAFIYIHVISGPAPAPLSLKSSSPAATGGTSSAPATSTSASTSASSGALAGTWQVGSGSVVGYRVKEVLMGQDNLAVGRTSSVTGQLSISGTTVTAGTFTVQMATVKSDESERDVQFNGRIMNTSQYPTGTLRLTAPIALAPVPAAGTVKAYHAAGQLTLHGHTRPVSFTLSAERSGSGLEVSGAIPIVFADYDIGNPSFGSFVTTQNHGELEFLLKFGKS